MRRPRRRTAPLAAVLTAVLLLVAPGATAAGTTAQDGFGRTVSGGLGTADTGGTWTTSGTRSAISVSGGAAHLSNGKGATLAGYLTGVSAVDTDVSATFSVSSRPTGGGVYDSLIARRTSGSDYSARLVLKESGAVAIAAYRDQTSLKSVNVSGWTATPGRAIRVRVQATGTNPTTVQARTWRVGTTEPTAWQVTATDATAALQSAGAVGIRSYLSSTATAAPVITNVDDLAVQDLRATTPVDAPPTASFTSTSSGLTATFDGSASSDREGPISGHAWSFGDGTAGTGSRPTHTYAAAGTYSVGLTVQDGSGAKATTTASVTLTAPASTRPTQAQWLADVEKALAGATDHIDAQQPMPSSPAIVLDIDNTALQSYYQPFAATPATLRLAQRAQQDGYKVLFATGRSADTGGTLRQLTTAGYRVDGLCFRDPAATSTEASKIACRAAWAAQGSTIVANVGNHTKD